MEVADQYHYVFDPEDFNFVAIRDRIRCYYKSYVQTARKRGLQLPTASPSKRVKLEKDKAKDATVSGDKGDATTNKVKPATKDSASETSDGDAAAAESTEGK